MKQWPEPVVGTLCVLAATVGFASQGIVVKFLFQEKAAILSILLLRKVLFIPLYGGVFYHSLRQEAGKIPTKYKTLALAAGVFGYYLAPFSSLHALQNIGAGEERLILYCFPGIVILLQALVNRKPPSLIQLSLFLVAQVGIYFVISNGNHHAVSRAEAHGAAWVLAGAVFFSLYVVFNHELIRHMSTRAFIFYALCGAFIAVFIHFLLAEPLSALNLTPAAWGYVAVFALFSTFVPIYLFSEGVKRIGSGQASLMSMASPFLTVVFAYLLLGETLALPQIFGGCIIIASMLVLQVIGMMKWQAMAMKE